MRGRSFTSFCVGAAFWVFFGLKGVIKGALERTTQGSSVAAPTGILLLSLRLGSISRWSVSTAGIWRLGRPRFRCAVGHGSFDCIDLSSRQEGTGVSSKILASSKMVLGRGVASYLSPRWIVTIQIYRKLTLGNLGWQTFILWFHLLHFYRAF
jgi:hypothetical protein